MNRRQPAQNRSPWWLVAILMAMNIVAYLDRSILALAAPRVQEDLALNHVQLSLLIGLGFIVAFVVIGIPFGWLVDRVARRPLVFAGIAIWSISASAAGMARNFAMLFVARIGVGAGESALNPAAYSLIADGVPPRRLSLALTLYGGSSGLGAAVSVGIGGLLLQYATAHGSFTLPWLGHVKPWQFVLLISGLPGLLLAPAIFLIPEPLRRNPDAPTPADVGSGEVFAFLRQHWRFYALLIAGFSILQINAYAFSAWQPSYMVKHFGWKIADVGGWLSIGMLASFAGSFFAGWFVDALSARGVADAPLRWTSAVAIHCALFIGAAFLVSNAWACVALVVVAQLPIAAIGVVSSAIQQVTPNELRGRISAIFLLVSNLVGFGLGPFLPAALTDYVFRSDDYLGTSIACVAFATGPVAALLIMAACKPMRHALAAVAQDGRKPVARAVETLKTDPTPLHH